MSGESPVAAATIATTVFGYAIFEVAATGLNPDHPSFPMFLAFLGATAGAWWSLMTRRGREDMRDRAFLCSFAAGSVGLAIYAGCLVASLL